MTCGKKTTRKYKAQLSKAEQKRFRSLMWEFRRDPKDLKPEEREALERLFVELPVLKDVYDVRVRFKAIFDTAPDRTTAEQQLAELIRRRVQVVEILVAQLGNKIRPTKLYRIAYEGTISDESRFAVLGGDAETIRGRFAATEEVIHPLRETLKNAVSALAGPERSIETSELEVGILEDRGARRTFLRLNDEQVSELLR